MGWTVSDILNAVLRAGLRREAFNEYEREFHQWFPSMTSEDGRWYRLPQYDGMLPLLFTLRARKPPR